MKVFFTASSSEAKQPDKKNYINIMNRVVKMGHTITHPYFKTLISKKVDKSEYSLTEKDDVFGILRKLLVASDCVITEISAPSVSLGIQIEYALNNKIPVLCLLHQGQDDKLPLMIRDYRNNLLMKEVYNSENIDNILKSFFSNMPKTRIKFNMFITHNIDKYLSYLSNKEKKPKSEVIRELIEDKIENDDEYTP